MTKRQIRPDLGHGLYIPKQFRLVDTGRGLCCRLLIVTPSGDIGDIFDMRTNLLTRTSSLLGCVIRLTWTLFTSIRQHETLRVMFEMLRI